MLGWEQQRCARAFRRAGLPILAQLAATGETVAHADVGDPAKFHAALQTAVAEYVQLTRKLRSKVPANLRSDVDQLSTAAQQYRFSDAAAAHTAITDYARSKCATTTTKSTG